MSIKGFILIIILLQILGSTLTLTCSPLESEIGSVESEKYLPDQERPCARCWCTEPLQNM